MLAVWRCRDGTLEAAEVHRVEGVTRCPVIQAALNALVQFSLPRFYGRAKLGKLLFPPIQSGNADFEEVRKFHIGRAELAQLLGLSNVLRLV